jgi:hypothetical protein
LSKSVLKQKSEFISKEVNMNFQKISFAIAISLVCSFQLLGKEIILENELLKVKFNQNTGALESLISKATGWEIQKRSELAQSFRMLVPKPNQRHNPVLGIKQKPPEIYFDKIKNQVTLKWNNLSSELGGELDIEFIGNIQLTKDGLIFTAKVKNQSPYVIETIYWPYLGDLTAPPGTDIFSQLGMRYSGVKEMQLFPEFDNEPGYFAVDYPSQTMFTPRTPFSLLNSGGEGIYVGYHDTTAEHMLQFWAQLKPGYVSYELWDTGVNPQTDSIAGKPVHLEFSTIHFPFFSSGESGKLKPIVMQPYQGTWHKGADLYKKYRRTWFKAQPKPGWLEQVHSWQQIHLNNPEDFIRYKYQDLKEIGKDCARHGVKAIQVTGWTIGGQDEGNPSHDIDPRLGSQNELREAIETIQKMGVNVILFTKFTWADRSQDWYRNELINYATKDPYGDPHYHGGYAYQTATQLAEINTHRFAPMCHLSKDWREIANNEFIKPINLGADGMLFDENQHHGGAFYCFDKDHGHHIPAFIYAGDEYLAQGFHQVSSKLKPNYLFAGEGNYDLEFRHYHLSYFRVDLNHVPMHRYIAPNEEMMIAVSGYNDRNIINLALMYRYIISYEPRNFKGRLDEFPQTIEYGKKVDALRKRYSNFLWHGEFQHTIGATVTSNGKIHKNYSVFTDRKTGNRAIVITNFDYDSEISCEIKFEGKNLPLVKATPENPESVDFQRDITILTNSALLVMEK